MAFYRYRVIQNGRHTETTIEAASEAEAAHTLLRRNVLIVKLLEASSSQKEERKSAFRIFDRGRFNVYVFTERLAPLLKANVPLEQSLAVIEESMMGQSGIIVVQELRRGLTIVFICAFFFLGFSIGFGTCVEEFSKCTMRCPPGF